MKIEHFALNVADPLGVARWYVDHLGLTVKRRQMEAPWGHFLADDSGTVMLEIYGNPSAGCLPFAEQHPMTLHLALVSRDVDKDVERLVKAGCKLEGTVTTGPNGDQLAMLRDPWGFCVQLVKRAQAMI